MAVDHEHAGAQVTFEHNGVAVGPVPKPGPKAGIVVARFNGAITKRLYQAAVDALLEAGYEADEIAAIEVPGAVEAPLAARALVRQKDMDLVVVLACVIQGETAHFDYVCRAVTDGTMRVSLLSGVPIGFGVLTCNTVAEADARSGLAAGERNVGADAALAALEMRDKLEPGGRGDAAAAKGSPGLGFG